jgi:hypothetical protein
MDHVDERTLVEFVWLTHIEHNHATSVNLGLGFLGADLGNGRTRRSEKVSKTCHV